MIILSVAIFYGNCLLFNVVFASAHLTYNSMLRLITLCKDTDGALKLQHLLCRQSVTVTASVCLRYVSGISHPTHPVPPCAAKDNTCCSTSSVRHSGKDTHTHYTCIQWGAVICILYSCRHTHTNSLLNTD